MKRGLDRLIVAVMAVVATACVNLGAGTSSLTRYYLLASTSTAAIATGQTSPLADKAIGVGPVSIPPYLERPQMMVRVSDQELKPDDFSHWAEPLKANIARVVGEDLALLTGSGHIRLYPWTRSTPMDYQVAVDVHRFDADGDGEVFLRAGWRILDPHGRQLLSERQSTIQRTADGADTGDVVAAMSLALAELDRQIADALADLSPR